MAKKTKEVHQLILNEILDGKYDIGKRLPSERDMSGIMKLSRVTVRRGYDELEKKGIIIRKDRSGTFLNTSYATSSQYPQMVAVLASLNDFFALEFIDALERILRQSEIFLIIQQTEKDPGIEKKVAMDLMRRGITNMIVWASGDSYDAVFFSRLRMVGINLVFFDRMLPGPFADFVGSDNEHGVQQIVKDGIKKGIRRFVYVGYENVHWSSFVQREKTFCTLCERKGLSYRIVKVPWSDQTTHVINGYSRDVLHGIKDEASYDLIRTGLSEWKGGDRTAFVCVNDYIALQVKQIDQDAVVYGFDALPEALTAGIVTYRHPMGEMAQEAIRLLLSQQELSSQWQPQISYCKGTLVKM